MTFVLPPRSAVGVLDREIAGEGQKVILSDGDTVNWSPPPVNPVIPDVSQIKSIRHYFNRRNHPIWPAWLYHPTHEARLVKNADEAAELGVCYREATVDERGKYGRSHVWDWADDSQWRPTPYNAGKFDPANPGTGKTYTPTPANPSLAQNAMIADLVPAVAAAVAQSLRASGAAAPANIDPAQWDEFIQFQAWKKTTEAAASIEGDQSGPALSADGTGADAERVLWADEARRKGIKIDGRWSLERLKNEVERAADPRGVPFEGVA